jgi:hypothetical protein
MPLHQQSGDRKLKGVDVGRLAANEGDLRASHATADRNDSVQGAVLVVITTPCQGAARSSMDEFHHLRFSLDDTTRLYARRFQEGLRALSLELTHCKALVILAESSGIDQRRLAEICHLDPAQVTRVLDLLEALG